MQVRFNTGGVFQLDIHDEDDIHNRLDTTDVEISAGEEVEVGEIYKYEDEEGNSPEPPTFNLRYADEPNCVIVNVPGSIFKMARPSAT